MIKLTGKIKRVEPIDRVSIVEILHDSDLDDNYKQGPYKQSVSLSQKANLAALSRPSSPLLQRIKEGRALCSCKISHDPYQGRKD